MGFAASRALRACFMQVWLLPGAQAQQLTADIGLLHGEFSKLGSPFRSPLQYGTLMKRTLKGTLLLRTTHIGVRFRVWGLGFRVLASLGVLAPSMTRVVPFQGRFRKGAVLS